MSVTGCRRVRAAMGWPNCSITVNGSWWRPTVAIPKSRSDGAMSTGAASAAVSTTASAETATTSAARAVIPHHCHNQQKRGGERPGPDVPDVGREAGIPDHDEQHRKGDHLR